MTENTVFVRCYSSADDRLAVDKSEILRYSGCPVSARTGPEMNRLFEETLAGLDGAFSYKVCWRRMALPWRDGLPVLPWCSEPQEPTPPRDMQTLASLLRGCTEIILFGATVGLGVDRYIARYQHISPVKALFAQGYGAERIECLCDVFCADMRDDAVQESMRCTNRFSPGYGPVPLAYQSDFFRLLDCTHRIGVSLSGSKMMTPTKSVTAFFGLAPLDD